MVEDEPSWAELLRFHLSRSGFEVLLASSLSQAWRRAEEGVEAAVVDLMLPDGDGLELVRRLAGSGRIPVVVVTAKGEEEDRVRGLDLGADDYLVKPFSPKELLARLRAVLRRHRREFWPFRLDPARRAVVTGEREVLLSPREFQLLSCFLEHPGQPLSRDRLLDLVWGEDYEGDPRVVDVHVCRLREKMGERIIRTVRGAGYLLDPEKMRA